MCGLAPRRAPRQVLPVTWKLKGTTGAADGHEEFRFAMTVARLCFKTLGLKDLLGSLF